MESEQQKIRQHGIFIEFYTGELDAYIKTLEDFKDNFRDPTDESLPLWPDDLTVLLYILRKARDGNDG